MQNDKTISDIVFSLKTREDVSHLMGELEVLRGSLFKIGSGSWDEVMSSQVSETTARALVGLNPGDRESFLKKLMDYLKDVRLLRLTISFAPSSKGVDGMSVWAKNNLGADVVLDLKNDPNILGGAVIEFGGKYVDKSLSSALDSYFHQGQISKQV